MICSCTCPLLKGGETCTSFLTLSLSSCWTLGILALFGSPNAERWVDLDLVRKLSFTQNCKLLWSVVTELLVVHTILALLLQKTGSFYVIFSILLDFIK